MTSPYRLPAARPELDTPPRTAYLVASGDLRPAANAAGWPAQEALEKAVGAAFADLGWSVVRAHGVDAGRPARVHRQPAQGAGGVRDDPARTRR